MRSASAFRAIYLSIAACVLLAGVPIFMVGAGFAGGFGSALNSFRLGLAELSPFDWAFLLPLILLPAYWWVGKIQRPRLQSHWPTKLLIGAACAFGLFLLFGQIEDTPVAQLPSACHRGAYRLDDGRIMAVSVSPVAALNVTMSDGTYAMTWTGDNLSFGGERSCSGDDRMRGDFALTARQCPSPEFIVDARGSSQQVARRLPMREVAADFRNAGEKMRGRLFLPAGSNAVPLVIIPADRRGVSNIDWGAEQYLLAGLGVAVFLYDKPETYPFGVSGIETDKEANELAAAAFQRARRMLGPRASRIGFYGGRDAIHAASRTGADFVAATTSRLEDLPQPGWRKPALLLVPGGDRAQATALVQAIRALQAAGAPVQSVMFPDADENMMRRRGDKNCGEPGSYYPLLAKWLLGRQTSNRPNLVAFEPPGVSQ